METVNQAFTSNILTTNALQDEWANIPTDTLKNVVESLPSRGDTVIAAK